MERAWTVGVMVGIAVAVSAGVLAPAGPSYAKSDKTPPVISALRADSITGTSAIIRWTTDEPADSSVDYGVDPKTNLKGPSDPTLVLDHAAVLSGLTPDTTYAFCVTSADAANNKTTACGTFFAVAPSAPQPGGTISTVAQPPVSVQGVAFPYAIIRAQLYRIPFAKTYERTTVAHGGGAFDVSFDGFPQGAYQFTISVTDPDGASSARKGFQFNYFSGGIVLEKRGLILPPTLSVAPEAVARGDSIAATGYTLPGTTVVVQAGSATFETESIGSGAYRILIPSAQFSPGTVFIRARSAVASESGYDWSPTKIVTVSQTAFSQADLNKDGFINIKDVSIFLTNPFDLNGDGKVNAADFSILLRAL